MAQQLVESVEYKLSVTGQQAASKAIKALKADQDALNKSFDTLGDKAPTSVDRLRSRFDTLGKEVSEDVAFVRQLNKELAALDGKKVSTTIDTEVTGEGAGRQGSRSRLGRFAVDLRNLPAVPIPGTGITSDAAAKLLNVVDIGLTALGPAAVAAGLGAGALAFGLSEVTRRTEEATSAAQLFKDQIGGVFDIVASGGGTDDISQRLEQARNEQRSLEQQLAFNRDLFQEASDAALARLPGVDIKSIAGSNQFSNAANEEIQRITGGAVLDMTSLSAVIEQLEQEAKTATTTVGTYTLQLDSFEVTLNDVRIAQAKAEAELVQSAMNRFNAEAEAARFAETATVESTQKRIDAAQNEVNRLLLINAELGKLNTDAAKTQIEANNVRIVEQQLIVETTSAITGSVAARAAEEEAIKKVADSIKAASTIGRQITSQTDAVESAADKVVAAEQALADARTESAAKVAEIQQKLAEDDAKIRADADEELRRLALDHGVDLLEAQQDFNTTMARLREDEATDQLNFIGERDAEAAYLSEQQSKIELRREDEDHRVEEARRKAAFQRQLSDLANKTNRELQTLHAGAEKSIQIEQAKASQEVALRQRNLDLMIQQYQAAYTYLQSLFNAAIAGLSYTPDNNNVIVPDATYGVSNEDIFRLLGINGYASGGRFSAGTTALVGEKGPEIVHFDRSGRVFNNQESRAMAGNSNSTFNFNPTIVGSDRQRIKHMVLQVLDEVFDEAEKN